MGQEKKTSHFDNHYWSQFLPAMGTHGACSPVRQQSSCWDHQHCCICFGHSLKNKKDVLHENNNAPITSQSHRNDVVFNHPFVLYYKLSIQSWDPKALTRFPAIGKHCQSSKHNEAKHVLSLCWRLNLPLFSSTYIQSVGGVASFYFLKFIWTLIEFPDNFDQCPFPKRSVGRLTS